ncbi:MAG: TetR/AcrR family transcriptional regulator [Candidatus Marinimicrobia bacterium]|nr:TetR/AcrR family transcriptional regulator [Candidatus Neomarinimicrobiota bacterium]
MPKKHQIIEAAIRVFAREGLEKGKIADIAKEAGIGKGTVYEYFSSKADVFKAIEEHVTTGMIDVVAEVLKKPVSAEEKLRLIFSISVEHINHMGDELLIVTELLVHGARGHMFDEGTNTMVDMYSTYRELVETILIEGLQNGEFREINPPGIATLFLAFIDGIVWQYVFIKDTSNFKLLLDEALESFLKGIKL